MKFLEYIKDKIINILFYLNTMLFIFLILRAFKIEFYINIIIFIILLSNGIVILTFSYFRKYRFYNLFLSNLEKLDKKYFVLETIVEPNTYEEKIMVNSMYEINKSMIENIKIQKKVLMNLKNL